MLSLLLTVACLITLPHILLSILGWKPLSVDVKRAIAAHDRAVVIFSHSSLWDFFFCLLYTLTSLDLIRKVWVLMRPQSFERWGWILRFYAIPATRVEDKEGGSTARIIEHFRRRNEFFLLLSPKGTRPRVPWRSGYYHIAKELHCPIAVIGLDYGEHEVRVISVTMPTLPKEETEEYYKQQLKEIAPLHPENEWYAREAETCAVSPNFVLLLWLLWFIL